MEQGGGGYGGLNGDGRRLDLGWWTHSTIYRWCVIELYAWNRYNFVNQCRPQNSIKRKTWKKKSSCNKLKKTSYLWEKKGILKGHLVNYCSRVRSWADLSILRRVWSQVVYVTGCATPPAPLQAQNDNQCWAFARCAQIGGATFPASADEWCGHITGLEMFSEAVKTLHIEARSVCSVSKRACMCASRANHGQQCGDFQGVGSRRKWRRGEGLTCGRMEIWRGVVNTQHSVQMMCCGIVHLKPV